MLEKDSKKVSMHVIPYSHNKLKAPIVLLFNCMINYRTYILFLFYQQLYIMYKLYVML